MRLRRPNLPGSWIAVGFAAALAGLGSATAAGVGSDRPTVTDVEKYCDLEEQGARQLAVDLKRREREIDSRERALGAQRAEMEAAEARLQTRLAELEKARTQLKEELATADAERGAKLTALVKMVEANRATAVAPMFQKLDPALAVHVLDRMNRTKAGRLLAALPAAQAASLAERMTAPINVELP